MKVHLRQIHAEGLHLEGEEEFPIPDLVTEDVHWTGPLRYALDLGIAEGALWATGSLAQPVELRCVRCLEPFPFDIEVKAFSIRLDLTGPELIDLTPHLREDILLNLPAHPHCDREGGRVCPAEKRTAGDRLVPHAFRALFEGDSAEPVQPGHSTGTSGKN